MRKNCSIDREKLLKVEAESREFSKILRSLKQFIQTVEGQNTDLLKIGTNNWVVAGQEQV